MKRLLLVSIALGFLALTIPRAQMRVVPLGDQQGHIALGLVLRHLANTGIFMQTTAHPDDENNGLLVMLGRGQGYRTALATATRGNGGQNEIGREIFEALGVLRTEELAALHRFDGAEQYFTRAVDFGYSFSIEETFDKWGKDEIIGDYVRLIRTIRPDVITGMRPDGDGGGQHHQASAILSREAFKLAADPTKYLEQIKEGLRSWQPKKFYFIDRFAGVETAPTAGLKVVPINLAVYDPLLGKTYSEIGTEARSMHKCQGMAQLLSLPAPVVTSYQLVESAIPGQMQRDERTLFDAVDTSIVGLAKFAGATAPKEITDGLVAIGSSVQSAQKAFDGESDEATLAPLLDGLRAVRATRAIVGREARLEDAARFEIDFRLGQKEREFQQAILFANGVRVEALADHGIVIPGQAVKVSVIVANRGAAAVDVKQVKFIGFDGDAACALNAVVQSAGFGGVGGRGGRGGTLPAGPTISLLQKDQVARCEPTMKIPVTARVNEPYWHRNGEDGRYTFDADAPFGLPFRPTPFSVQMTLEFPGGEQVIHNLPVEVRYEGDIFSGEKRSELFVVPALSVRVSPKVAIIPADSIAEREIRVTVVNGSPGAVESVIKLDLPPGWTASPAQQPVRLARQDESQTVRFAVKPAVLTRAGAYRVRAIVSDGAQTFGRGYQVVEYPHIRRRHIYEVAETTLKVIDVKTAPNLSVGYIMGVGDEVPSAITQLGAKLEFIGADDLAWGNLSRFDTIVSGVRAYERRQDLRANNSRLLDYVSNGGTFIVQYNKFEFNDVQYGPYPAKVGSNRVTDEHSPVTVLAPADPVFTFPNKITDAAWNGWVQERGLYFLGERDSRYRDLVQLEDPFPYNKGEKRGALVEAAYGQGRWVYVGLGLWRELPAGVDGAYQILANLISLGRTPVAKP